MFVMKTIRKNILESIESTLFFIPQKIFRFQINEF